MNVYNMKLNRRTVLLASVTSVIAIAGCIGDEPRESGNESTNDSDQGDDQPSGTDSESADESDAVDDNQSDDETGSIGPSDAAFIRVYITVDIPDDATILDAEEDSLLENEHLEAALEQADEEYEPEMEDELDPEDQGEFGTELVENRIRNDELGGAIQTLGRDNEDISLQWYVEYNETAYMIRGERPPE